MEKELCVLCGQNATVSYNGPLNQQISYRCPNCGRFSVSSVFHDRDVDVHSRIPKELLSGYVREMNDYGKTGIFITSTNWEDMINDPIVPKTINGKANKLLQFLHRKSSYYKEPISLYDGSQPAICYAKNRQEFISIVQDLVNNGYLESNGKLSNAEYWLTLKGEQYITQIDKPENKSKLVFVAMWFATGMNSVYENAIKPAIEASECGNYKAFRVDNKEFNDDITDMIISGIKESCFTVADLTGCRGGVYYEAGFARGLGQQVILTCHKDWQFTKTHTDDNGNIIVDQEGVHFDLNHLNIIFWEDEEALKDKLIDRIKATIT